MLDLRGVHPTAHIRYWAKRAAGAVVPTITNLPRVAWSAGASAVIGRPEQVSPYLQRPMSPGRCRVSCADRGVTGESGGQHRPVDGWRHDQPESWCDGLLCAV